MSQIRFQIIPPVSHPEETISIVGGISALGNWNPAHALRLTYQPPYHTGVVEVSEGQELEYKILRQNWESEAVDAYGHVLANYHHSVWFDATVRHVVADWKDRFHGHLIRDYVPSRYLASGRELLIWLPLEYSTHPDQRFPVVVMHDGKNVFDPATSPLSGVDWAADEWVRNLSKTGAFPPALVVGVCHPEGFGEDEASLREMDLSPELGGAAYSAFLCEELLPYLDSHYRTWARADARVLAGGALGGLNTVFTMLQHPGVFGHGACHSTSFEDVSQSVPSASGILRRIEEAKALPAQTRLYFDYGTQGIDECYEPYHRELQALLGHHGWTAGKEFAIQQIPGGSHDEISWRLRFGKALRFLGSSLFHG